MGSKQQPPREAMAAAWGSLDPRPHHHPSPNPPPPHHRPRVAQLLHPKLMCLKLNKAPVHCSAKATAFHAIQEALKDPDMTVREETVPTEGLRVWKVEWKPSGLLGLMLPKPLALFVFLEEEHIAKIRAGFGAEQSLSPTQQMMLANKWNSEKRFTKAFIMDGPDGISAICLETDVDFEWLGGSPAASFKRILDTFKMSAFAFGAEGGQEAIRRSKEIVGPAPETLKLRWVADS